MLSQAHTEPRVLVLHRRELRDVCDALEELGVAFEERQSAMGSGDADTPLQLIVATPQRILDLRGSSVDATHVVAVCDGFSKTLAAKLGQARVDFVLRRPVHPGALRLLLLHVLYRGPEKRRFRRVSVGAPLQVRVGWRRRNAMLLELSTTGCRVQLDAMPRANAGISLYLPPDLTGLRRPLRLRGHVVRILASNNTERTASHEVAVQFGDLARNAFDTVSQLVRDYGKGPASWKDAPKAESEPREEAEPMPSFAPRDRDEPDRRRSPRLRYAKPVLVKGEGASRVLMGRDLSTGGMRVMRDPNLTVGDALKIALYGEDGIPPLMLQAEVAREDGPFLVLRFEDPGDGGLDHLHRLMTSLPLSGADDAGEATALIVSEIVEQS